MAVRACASLYRSGFLGMSERHMDKGSPHMSRVSLSLYAFSVELLQGLFCTLDTFLLESLI